MTAKATDAISGKTHLVTLLGNPTGHSLSPAIHNLSFQLLGIDAVYLCFDVENDDLGTIVGALRAVERWDGANVTMPCKQAIIPHLDAIDEAAELIGAVNVVNKEAGRVVGYNTDGIGFMANLARHGVEARGARMVLLGPGGAGSAIIVQAALDGVARIDAFARAGGPSHRHAAGLIERMEGRTTCSVALHDLNNGATLAEHIAQADIVVNATSVGMGEGCTDTLVAPELLRPGQAVADAIYHPRETRLICDARARGCTAVPGLGMIFEQAAAGEAIWYGVQMPLEQVMRSVAVAEG